MIFARFKLRRAVKSKLRKAERALQYTPDIHNPRTFNEKIIRRCFQPVDPIMTRTSDKHAVKGWLNEARQADAALHDLHPVPELWHGTGPVPWDELAYPCVLKANHSWNMHRILQAPPTPDEAAAIDAEARTWLTYRFGRSTYEPQYAGIEPLLMVEALVADNTDYKCFVFGGKVEFVLVAKDRDTGTRSVSLDPQGKPLPFIRGTSDSLQDADITLPPQFSRMIEMAEALTPHLGAPGQEFVRLDFYISEGTVYLGEVTWTPGGGRLPFTPRHWDEDFGDKFKLVIQPMVPPAG
jgi:hypothetical protein